MLTPNNLLHIRTFREKSKLQKGKKYEKNLEVSSLDMLIRTLRADMITLNLKKEEKCYIKLFSHFLMKINYLTNTIASCAKRKEKICWSVSRN